MKKKKSIVMFLLVFVILLNINNNFTSALEDENEITVVKIFRPSIKENSKKIYIEKFDKNRDILPKYTIPGPGTARYLYTTYTVDHTEMMGHNVKPYINHKVLISLTKGASGTLKKSVTIKGSIKIDGSATIEMKNAISSYFGLSLLGEYSETFEKGYSFEWPEEYNGKYKTCTYYGAVGYDEHKVVLKKTEIWQVNGIAGGFFTKDGGTEERIIYVPFVAMYKRGSSR